MGENTDKEGTVREGASMLRHFHSGCCPIDNQTNALAKKDIQFFFLNFMNALLNEGYFTTQKLKT